MAYATQTEIQNASGGAGALLEVVNNGAGAVDAVLLAQAQAFADSEIDAYARRLYGDYLPFGTISPYLTVPPKIAALAAEEAVYRLRLWKRVLGDGDVEARRQREDVIYPAIAAGQYIPIPDDYPIGAPGVPRVTERTTSTDGTGPESRDSMKGWW